MRRGSGGAARCVGGGGSRLLVADPLLLLHQHRVMARILLGRQQVGVEEALPLLLGLHLKGL